MIKKKIKEKPIVVIKKKHARYAKEPIPVVETTTRKKIKEGKQKYLLQE